MFVTNERTEDLLWKGMFVTDAKTKNCSVKELWTGRFF